MSAEKDKKKFIPAVGFHWLTRFSDPLIHWTTREKVFKNALLEQSNIQNGQTLLDLACGTANLTILVKQKFPAAKVYAIDADEQILAIAKQKARKAQVEIFFNEGFSDILPFREAAFDRVVSTLFFHHINYDVKIATLKEILRVLKIGGELHIADFGAPRNRLQSLLSKYLQLIDSVETTVDNLQGNLPGLMRENGFSEVERTAYFNTLLGTIRLFRAVKSN